MKIGMNDPCPCGSGKKYKKCCWGKEYDYKIELKKAMREFEEFYRGFKSNEKLKSFSDLDSLYASLKSYNNELLEKANAPYYIGANFYDSMELAITSNAISLIKGIFQANYAISIHKAQGLEYDSVKIIITNEIEELITHNIFYTAITRAKNKLKIYWSYKTEDEVLNKMKFMFNSLDATILARRYGLRLIK